MKVAGKMLEWLDNAINPIVVKEVRQAVAGRYLSVILNIFLALQLLVIGIYAASAAGGAWSPDAGLEWFYAIFTMLFFACSLFIPAQAMIRLSGERSGDNMDLMFVTTIKPRSVIWGKFFSTMLLVGLVYAACAPFLSVTYLMRGISLPMIFTTLAGSLLVVAAYVMFALFLASMPANNVSRPLIRVGYILAVLASSGVMSSLVLVELVDSGAMGGDWELLAMVVVFLMGIACAGAMMFALAVAMVSPPTANRAFWPRLTFMAAWLLSGAAAGFASFVVNDFGPLAVWQFMMMMALGVAIWVAVCERDEANVRLRLSVPRSLLGRWFAFLVFSGAAGGILWTLAMFAATCALGIAATQIDLLPSILGDVGMMESSFSVASVVFLYIASYCLTAAFIRRNLFAERMRAGATSIITSVMLAGGIILPTMVAILSGRGFDGLSDNWFLLSPLVVMLDGWDSNTIAPAFSLFWFLSILAINAPWMIGRFHQFRRMDRPVDDTTGAT